MPLDQGLGDEQSHAAAVMPPREDILDLDEWTAKFRDQPFGVEPRDGVVADMHELIWIKMNIERLMGVLPCPRMPRHGSLVCALEVSAMQNLSRRSTLALGLAASAALLVSRGVSAQISTVGSAEQRLRERGIELPRASAPVANYVPYVRTGNLIFLAGMGPLKPDGTLAVGKVGRDVSVEEAYQHARLTGLSLLAVLRGAVGSLDGVTRVVKVLGMVNAVPEFTDHPKVINGCSDLFVEVFGEQGRHARSAVGMGSLPFGISVEIEAIFEVA